MTLSQAVTVKTGHAEDFLARVKHIMRAADQGEALPTSHTVIFEDPSEMLQCLSAAKLRLIQCIRQGPGSISELAKATHRNRTAISRDIRVLKRFGLVKTHQAVNSGHGQQTRVELTAPSLKLEACI